MSRKMHLVQMLFHTPVNHLMMGWMDPSDRQYEGMGTFSYWQDIARTLERGLFDGVFFADTIGVHDQYRDSTDASVKYGVAWPSHDPMPAVAAMAAATSRLGFGVTLSMSGTPPYLAVRRISTLDYMSGGRVGWNIVTGLLRAEHRAMGSQPVEHDRRYDMADEYMDVCYKLWDGLEDGAIIADRPNGVFADPARVHFVSHHGEFYDCDAVPPAMKTGGKRPVLFQAGSSGRGMEFARKHADYVFAIQPDLERMQQYQKQADAKVMFGIQPILGSTEAEALRKVEEWTERVPLDAALSKMSGTLGIDLSKFDLDMPLDEMATNTSQGMMKTLAATHKGQRRTLREIARGTALSVLPQVAGTPEQVADRMEHLWRESGGHGFNLSPNAMPGSIVDFVDQVVPILQKKGVFRTEYEGQTMREILG